MSRNIPNTLGVRKVMTIKYVQKIILLTIRLNEIHDKCEDNAITTKLLN